MRIVANHRTVAADSVDAGETIIEPVTAHVQLTDRTGQHLLPTDFEYVVRSDKPDRPFSVFGHSRDGFPQGLRYPRDVKGPRCIIGQAARRGDPEHTLRVFVYEPYI